MIVRDLINAVSNLHPDTEVVLIKTDGRDNPVVDSDFTVTVGKITLDGQLLDNEDEDGYTVLMLG